MTPPYLMEIARELMPGMALKTRGVIERTLKQLHNAYSTPEEWSSAEPSKDGLYVVPMNPLPTMQRGFRYHRIVHPRGIESAAFQVNFFFLPLWAISQELHLQNNWYELQVDKALITFYVHQNEFTNAFRNRMDLEIEIPQFLKVHHDGKVTWHDELPEPPKCTLKFVD